MSPSFNFLAKFVPAILLGIAYITTPVIATPMLGQPNVAATRDIGNMSERSSSTCADPSLTRTVFQGFAVPDIAHLLIFREAFVHDTTALSNTSPLYSLQGAVFKAWQAQQPFTVPLFNLFNSDATEWLFLLGVDADLPPIVSGFKAGGVVAWVYNTEVCDSVPLMSASFAAKSDHYYTTDADEHAGLLAKGWSDGGVVAFVLPLT